jgi:hypothetical protein
MTYRIIAIVFLLGGEAFSVYAEMIAAKAHSLNVQSFQAVFARAFLQIAVAGALLIAGYMYGYRSFKNIWMVSALSITSILIMEPLIGYLVFQQLPTRGAVLGLILGALGFVVTFVF